MGIRIRRVANGKTGYSPYQVTLVDTESGTEFCGGAIINLFFIVSAAHCFYQRSIKDNDTSPRVYPRVRTEIRVVAGQYSSQWPDATEQVRYVEGLFFHPDFDPTTLNNDIAFIQLKSRLNFNTVVHSIPLPVRGREFSGNVTALGLGLTKIYSTEIREVPDTLQETQMRIISNDECRRAYIDPKDVVTSSMMCAKGYMNSTLCAGDSGYPAICQDQQAYLTSSHLPEAYHHSHDLLCGIASWAGGDIECSVDEDGTLRYPLSPTVFTKVSYFSSWIAFNIRKLKVASYFLCDNLQYVRQVEVCDFTKDCEDGSDEANCTILTTTATNSIEVPEISTVDLPMPTKKYLLSQTSTSATSYTNMETYRLLQTKSQE